ncbi:MAG: DUF951 domain-containing protein [Eubacteriaceae bacterium]|nr:DUF951 domain-containing protein [Eubacteriaceae bacterium]
MVSKRRKDNVLEIKKYAVGDIVEMKKPHPCGEKRFKIIRTGTDIKLKCVGCDHLVMMPRPKFVKMLKNIVESSNQN